MLARMLRQLIAFQCLLGAALGTWLHVSFQWSVLSAALLALAMPLITAVLTDLITWVRSRADEPWGPWFASLWGEMQAGLVIFLLRQPWAGPPPGLRPSTAPGPARMPVVLVHGYVCNHRIWDALAPRLQAQGHPVIAVDLEPVFGSIDRYAEVLDRAIQTACQQTGSGQVLVVGHSMGGLATRAYLRQHGSARVAGVVTLGTPHVGTQLAAGIATPNARQMQWHSPWLTELAASETDAVRALFRIALTPQDNIVFPQRAQVLPGVTPTVFEGLGHLQLCLEPRVLEWVQTTVRALESGAQPVMGGTQ